MRSLALVAVVACVAGLFAVTATIGGDDASSSSSSLRKLLQRILPAHTDDPNVWGVQSGPATGHSDAGGMIYDIKRDSVILVGTTHDTQFFQDDNASSVDCFVATVQLPSLAEEISEAAAANGNALPSDTRPNWKFTARYRVTTTNDLDRCEFVTAIWGDDGQEFNDQYYSAGTLAVRKNDDKQAVAVHPFLMQLHLNFFDDASGATNVSTSQQYKVLEKPVNPGGDFPLTLVNNDLIIPAAMTSDRQNVYVATIHRVLVVSRPNNQAQSSFQLSLGVSKYSTTTTPDENGNPFSEQWSRTYRTSIVEARNDGVPHVTSGMFHADGGLSPQQLHDLQNEQSQIEEEINHMEEEEQEYKEEEMNLHRHEYIHDGVLISGLEAIETENEGDQYLLIAGSAPGTREAVDHGGDANHTLSSHPFLDGRAAHIGDWDGFVAKVRAENGQVMSPPDSGSSDGRPVHNTWSFKVATQPRRNDFIQSICAAKVDPVLWTHDEPYIHKVAYVVGTTQGRLDGDENGGAFIIQLDLETMNLNWKKQIPGMQVHGLSCQVLVDVPSHGTTIRAESKDLLYVAGEVHGHMTVEMADGRKIVTDGHGETDIWVAQLRAGDGKINWFHQIGTSQQDRLAKNVNNPMLAEGKQAAAIGETGSAKGSLVLDRHGNAIVYGTTNGPLAMEKVSGDRWRDIFVLRLHRDDGSYRAIIPPPNYVQEDPLGSSGGTTTSAPAPAPNTGSSGSSSSSGSTSGAGSSATSVSSTNAPPPQTHGGAENEYSVNYGVVAAGFLVPVLVGLVIILATGRRGHLPEPTPAMEMTATSPKSDLSPQEGPLPPSVEPVSMLPTSRDSFF
ncbi:expressed unknown protein [Seminavis robusta]|uniref:Uncharacterized protein n=1 Tax=Seminavis robusta TaxID=568900 RepID=A0A9N8HNY6_9STRA|nr:expressed unknown protein [Seminavis robusta]|eukprot:Sro1023_g232510.1 n/a (841) ;mRNA; r:15364-17886